MRKESALPDAQVDESPRRKTLVFVLPVALFAVVGGFLGYGLTKDPSTLPSALIDKPAPYFRLPPLGSRDEVGFATSDLGGAPALVNVFASWCVPCRVEHPILTRLAKEGRIAIHGINYKDNEQDALRFLAELGDPYARIGVDSDGRVGIDWGVYGVPETYIVDRQGRIRHRHVGPIQARDLEQTILPLLKRLEQEAGATS